MKKSIFLFFALFVFIQCSFGQSNLNFGKKLVFDLSAGISLPAIQKKFSGNCTYFFNQGFGLGIEFGMSRYEVNSWNDQAQISNSLLKAPYNDEPGIENYYFNLNAKVGTISITPKFEFANRFLTKGYGLHHQIGVGVLYTKIDPSTISFTIEGDEDPFVNKKSYDYIYNSQFKIEKGPLFLYALQMRVPINSVISLNYSIRYQLQLVSSNFDTYVPALLASDTDPTVPATYLVDGNLLRSEIAFRNHFGFIGLTVGLSF